MREPKGRPPIEPTGKIQYDIGKRMLGAPIGSVTISSITDSAIATLTSADLSELELLRLCVNEVKKLNMHMASSMPEVRDEDIKW